MATEPEENIEICESNFKESGQSESHLVDVKKGKLLIGHRPKLNSLEKLRAEGYTHVVTVLGETEGAKRIGDAVKKAGLIWIWIPLDSGNIEKAEQQKDMLIEQVDSLKALFEDPSAHSQVYLHCSAGIHRTGMVSYLLLRRLGMSSVEAMQKLSSLRSITATGVGTKRLEWVEKNIDEKR